MKNFIFPLLFGFNLILLSFTAAELNWLTDFDAAIKNAKGNKKNILMSFSGSDWCANCTHLDKTFFQSEEFKAYAEKNLILLKVDFPAKGKNVLPPEQTTHKENIAERYNKKGLFPATLLLDAEGKTIGTFAQRLNTPEEYLENLKQIISH